MSEEEANGQGQAGDASEIENQETKTKETEGVQNPDGVVKKNRELLSKLKAEQERRQEIEDRLNEIEQDKLAQAGKKDELIDSLKSQLKEKEEKFKKTTQSFALKTVKQQVLDAAKGMGAEKPHLVERLADLSDVGVSDDFSVDSESLSIALGRVKEDAPELFKKQVAAPRDGTPSNSVEKKAVPQMNIEELKEKYKKLALGE